MNKPREIVITKQEVITKSGYYSFDTMSMTVNGNTIFKRDITPEASTNINNMLDGKYKSFKQYIQRVDEIDMVKTVNSKCVYRVGMFKGGI